MATIIAWNKINHRGLYFIVGLLSAFGISHFSTLVAGIIDGLIWSSTGGYNFESSVQSLNVKIGVYVVAEVVMIPFLLWKLFCVFRAKS